jgi:hypothetical protein
MHGGRQLFSPNLLVELEGSLLIRWVEESKNGEIYTSAHSPRRAGRGVAWRGEAMDAGARRACE